MSRVKFSAVGAAVIVSAAVAGVLMQTANARVREAPPSADSLVSAALARAKAEHKVVLIEFGASWCSWCKRFDAFVHAPEVAYIVANNYVVVNLTVQEREDKKALENAGGQDAMNNWGGGRSSLPFYVFLNTNGRKIADSNAMPDGTNVGFPGSARELQVFLGLIDRTASRLSTADRTKVVRYLNGGVGKTPR